MAGTQDGAGWIALRSAGQLFPLGGGSAASTAPAESTIGGELVGTAAADCRAPQPAACGDLSAFRGAVLLDLFPMRMGHRCTVASGDSGTVGAAEVASRPPAVLPSGHSATLRASAS